MIIDSSCARSHVIRGEGHGWGTFACESGADGRQVVVCAHLRPSLYVRVQPWSPRTFLIFF